jgi:hypothetical protein
MRSILMLLCVASVLLQRALRVNKTSKSIRLEWCRLELLYKEKTQTRLNIAGLTVAPVASTAGKPEAKSKPANDDDDDDDSGSETEEDTDDEKEDEEAVQPMELATEQYQLVDVESPDDVPLPESGEMNPLLAGAIPTAIFEASLSGMCVICVQYVCSSMRRRANASGCKRILTERRNSVP